MKSSKRPAETKRSLQEEEKVSQVRVNKILATTDFSAESQTGVRYAVTLADKLNARLTLLHVVEPSSFADGSESILLGRDETGVMALVQSKLDAMAEKECSAGSVSSLVRTGKAFHTVNMVASEVGAEMIVIATHGHTGAERVIFGSTAERVVRHAPCPVLTVPIHGTKGKNGKRPAFKIEKILVPVDFSDISSNALPWAAYLAGQFGAELVLLYVAHGSPTSYLLGPELMNHAIVPFMKQAEMDLERTAVTLSQSCSTKISSVVLEGTPFEEICQTAKSMGGDLIVLTTHGHTGLKHAWLGSTAERVVRHAACPVLTVR